MRCILLVGQGNGVSEVEESLEINGRSKEHGGISRSSGHGLKSAHEPTTHIFLVMEFIHAIRRPTILTRDHYDCGRL